MEALGTEHYHSRALSFGAGHTRDPRKRPSARSALEDPWLAAGSVQQRADGEQLGRVVQRLQRYNQQNAFRRTVLDMMVRARAPIRTSFARALLRSACAVVVVPGTHTHAHTHTHTRTHMTRIDEHTPTHSRCTRARAARTHARTTAFV